jgi:hypothetical protein
MFQQMTACAGVFSQYAICLFKYLHSAESHVAQIDDGRWYNKKFAHKIVFQHYIKNSRFSMYVIVMHFSFAKLYEKSEIFKRAIKLYRFTAINKSLGDCFFN